MIKVNVMYPYTEGARFDHAYYRDRHMPMVKARLGTACAYYTVEKGLSGRAPGSLPAFVAMCSFICDSAEGYQAAMQEHAAEILGDIANYTEVAPAIQGSDIVRAGRDWLKFPSNGLINVKCHKKIYFVLGRKNDSRIITKPTATTRYLPPHSSNGAMSQ